ncbi:MAG: ribosomal L7Ae/L30e/S12e/Gadd45 family protein [Aigarchaeota archaeon]|nr:ribosomal L7Ae/L30e/S12e/Gadd45 family protein [Aigarchaeota archaeon]MCX8192459.1 ribosomal L7Ae/L30e/S12e/Gadd45 family protein [Nitrososphaeria archaeon]MDW7986718.1 ribosomal L7Ae/L30e/S12e/Gadd45 family protein [Nitrososphaerota archaeon]
MLKEGSLEVESKDLKRHLEVINRTGKIIFGFRQSKISILNKKSKLVIFAKNCPPSLERELKIACNISGTPYLKVDVTSRELGFMAGKPFSSSVISIIDFGSSTLLEELTQTQEQV